MSGKCERDVGSGALAAALFERFDGALFGAGWIDFDAAGFDVLRACAGVVEAAVTKIDAVDAQCGSMQAAGDGAVHVKLAGSGFEIEHRARHAGVAIAEGVFVGAGFAHDRSGFEGAVQDPRGAVRRKKLQALAQAFTVYGGDGERADAAVGAAATASDPRSAAA